MGGVDLGREALDLCAIKTTRAGGEPGRVGGSGSGAVATVCTLH